MTRDLADAGRQPGARLPGLDADRRPAQPATRPPGVRRPGGPDRPARGDRPVRPSSRTRSPRPPAPPAARSRRRRSLFDPLADPPVAYDPAAASAALKKAGWTKAADGWHLPKAKAPLDDRAAQPGPGVQPGRLRGGRGGRPRLDGARDRRHPRAARPGRRSSRAGWPRASSRPRVGDVTIGLDPDLYPLLASSQTVTGGSNVIGLQDPALDKLLVAARGPGTMPARDGRLFGAPEAAREGSLPAPAGLRGRVDRGPRHARRTGRPAGRRPG